MATILRSGLCVLLAVLATAASAAAPNQPRLPPGLAKYIMVLWEPGTRKPNGETARRGEEPDLAQHGGRVEASWSSHRVIVVPLAAVRQLRAHQSVAYVQRVWTGESREEWLEPEPGPGPSAGARVASESDTDLTWGPVQYSYDSSGNIKQMGTAAELQAQAEDHYTYDSAGRLIGSRVNGKTERYQYDAFGNLTSKSVDGAVAVTNTVDGGSNRLAGEIYDAAGNVTTSRSGHALQYDSLNMVSSIQRFDTGRWMVYDASDERIGAVNGPYLSRWTIRGLNGQVLREFTGWETTIGSSYWEWKQDSIYADGGLVAADRQIWPEYATIQYGRRRHYHLDHLGSVRVVTDQEGRSISEHEYFPFGATQTRTHQEQLQPGDGHLDTHRFAGHTRDFLGSLDEQAADYLDYMHARYYDPKRGRFLSVDPARQSADLTRPQSWNRYAYVENNPINKVDPDGRVGILINLLKRGAKVAIKGGDVAATFAGVVSDVNTLRSSTATVGQKGMAALSLVSEIVSPVSLKDAKAMKAMVLANNKAAGKDAEATVAAQLSANGVTILGSQVAANTSDGRRVIDHLVQDASGIRAVEVKSGDAVRDATQVAKNSSMATEGATLVGKNAPSDLRGQTIRLDTEEVRVPRP